LRFLDSKSLYLNKGARLITNRKSYTGSRLLPNSMTLDDLERSNSGFYGFFGDLGLRDTFQEWIT